MYLGILLALDSELTQDVASHVVSFITRSKVSNEEGKPTHPVLVLIDRNTLGGQGIRIFHYAGHCLLGHKRGRVNDPIPRTRMQGGKEIEIPPALSILS